MPLAYAEQILKVNAIEHRNSIFKTAGPIRKKAF